MYGTIVPTWHALVGTMIIVTTLLCNASAQSLSAAGATDDVEIGIVQFGIDGGITLSDFHAPGSHAEQYTSRVSFHVGIAGRIVLTEHFALHGNLQYNRRGAVRQSDFDSRLFRLDFLEFSPMLTIRRPWSNGICPYLSAGAVLAWNVNALVDVEHGRIAETLRLTDIRSFNPGITLELGLEFGLARRLLIIGIGYHFFPLSIQRGSDPTTELGNEDLSVRLYILY